MSNMRFRIACLGILIAACLSPLSPFPVQDLETGKLIENVLCQADPGQSYALYLPSAFDPGKKWPILFLFDPGARGAAAVEAFRAAAETYGWVLAGSNNSTNGPMRESASAAWAVWVDALKRLSFDERRVYAAGFSGGARVASVFPQVIGRPIAGVIGCGAGLSIGHQARRSESRGLYRPDGFGGFQLRRDEEPGPRFRPVRRPPPLPLFRRSARLAGSILLRACRRLDGGHGHAGRPPAGR